MDISLTPELEAIVRRKVESGLYGDASEVVREALRMMEENQSARYQAKVDALRDVIQEGFDSGISASSALDVLERLRAEKDSIS
jgi:antitoxin ParD1/3/4